MDSHPQSSWLPITETAKEWSARIEDFRELIFMNSQHDTPIPHSAYIRIPFWVPIIGRQKGTLI